MVEIWTNGGGEEAQASKAHGEGPGQPKKAGDPISYLWMKEKPYTSPESRVVTAARAKATWWTLV